MLHVICTQLRPDHLGVLVGDSSRRSEELVKCLELRLFHRLLLVLVVLVVVLISLLLSSLFVEVVVVVVVVVLLKTDINAVHVSLQRWGIMERCFVTSFIHSIVLIGSIFFNPLFWKSAFVSFYHVSVPLGPTVHVIFFSCSCLHGRLCSSSADFMSNSTVFFFFVRGCPV